MRLDYQTIYQEINQVLLKLGFTTERAAACAQLFTETHQDGVYSHGLNRFPRFVKYIEKGFINIHAEPSLEFKKGVLERWNGHQGVGNLNAQLAMKQAITIAQEFGMGAVAMRNTNHWMRGGTYGWQAAEAGCIGICFTNTWPNMPPWGGINPTLGNNPLILAVPRQNGQHVVLDMAMTQFSYGKMQGQALKKEKLPVPGGYDAAGNLTDDAQAIMETERALPIGFWKGSGLSMLLDLMAGVLSGGKTTAKIGQQEDEYGVSQVFMCVDAAALDVDNLADTLIDEVISFTKSSQSVQADKPILYPGENTLRLRNENMKLGIPVEEAIWQKILEM